MSDKIRVLFVCMGNICRSPAGEAVFRNYVERRNLTPHIECDSCGTLREHQGEKADIRMIKAARSRGVEITSRARQIRPADLDQFDLILTMDSIVHEDVLAMAKSDEHRQKIHPMCQYHPDKDVTEVPDPYYGREEGFSMVLDMLEIACVRLLDRIMIQHNLAQ